MKQKKQKKNLLPVWSGSETQQLNSAYFATFMNVAVRLALLCMAAAGVILMFLQMYEVPVNARVVIAQTVFFSLIFNITFIFVRFRFAFPFFGFILLLYLRFSDILHDLGCLADYLLIYIDGGALSTAGYASRPAAMVTVRITYELQQSMQEAVIFCAIILVFIFAVAARGKFIGSILITSVLLLVPAIASQKASYVPAITLLVSSMFGLYSIWASQEQSFLKSISRKRKSKKPPYIPQIHRHSVNGAASACLALVTIMTAQALLPLEKARDTIQFWGQASERV
ncbi:MAG: hypothetical protein FWD48_10540, partial [Oscillospiraceae bacterium]|nr:hypothetical protein [Oscillospiraceae bacterium]